MMDDETDSSQEFSVISREHEAKVRRVSTPPVSKPSKCACEVPGWINRTEKPEADCACNYLNRYAAFALEEASTDADVEVLYRETIRLIPGGIKAQADRIKKLARALPSKPSESGIIHDSDAYWMNHLLSPDMENMSKLVIMGLKAHHSQGTSSELSRLDKVLAIENFVNIAHKSGPMLTQACNAKGELGMTIMDKTVKQVLNCLAEQPANPDQVMKRLVRE